MEAKNKILKKSDIFYHIVKGWRIILLFTLIGLIVGVSIIGFGYIRGEMTREYRINTSVALIDLNSNGNYMGDTDEPFGTDLEVARHLVESSIYVIKSRRNLETVADRIGQQGISAGRISSNLSVSRYAETEIIEMNLLWRTESEGIDIMNEIIDVTNETLIKTIRIGGLSVINEPKASFIVGGNISISTWFYAALIGLISGVLFCILRFVLGTTVINEIDMEDLFGMDSLGAMPLDVAYARTKPLESEELSVNDDIKSISHLLINRMETAGAKKLYFTSAAHGEGTTRLIADVALQISLLGKKTLLIDCNFKNPMLSMMLTQNRNLTYVQSLNALYRGDSDKVDAIVFINGCLDLLPVMLEEKPESFNDAMLGVLADVTQGYDYVLIDASPVGVDAEVLRLNEVVDTAVFVIRCDYTKVDDIRRALLRIGKSKIPVAGGVFNCVVNWRQTFLNTPKHLSAALKKEAKKALKKTQKTEKEAAKKKKAEKKKEAKDSDEKKEEQQ